MHDLATFDLPDMVACGAALRSSTQSAGTMDAAAGEIVRYLYANVGDAATGRPAFALVRCFKTHAYGSLPSELQHSVSRHDGDRIDPGTRCLTLLATVGERPEWNDPHRSVSHRVIPLSSPELVAQSPMISQLIAQFGLTIPQALSADRNLLAGAVPRYHMFHVADAHGSPHVPDQDDFVVPEGIRSVVGFGGLLPSGELLAVIAFSRVTIPVDIAELFRTLGLSVLLALCPYGPRPFGSTTPPAANADSDETTDPAVVHHANRLLTELLSVTERTALRQTDRLTERYEALEQAEAGLRRTSEALRASEEQFRRLFEHTPVGQFAVDAEGRFVQCNPAMCELLGRSEGELLRSDIFAVTHPSDDDRTRRMFAEIAGGSVPYVHLEKLLVHQRGHALPVEVSASLLRDADGRITGMVGLVQDISERKAAEAALRATEAQFRQLVEASPLAIVQLDSAGRVRVWNAAAERLFGWSAEEVLGRPEPGTGAIPEESLSMSDSVARGRVFTNYRTTRTRKDGALVDVVMAAGPLYRADGKADGEMRLATDVTQQRLDEEELRQAQKLDAIGRLAGGIAHDFNNILTAVLGYTRMLLRQLPADATIRPDLEVIDHAAQRAADLADQLLAFAREQPVTPVVVDVNEVVRSVISLLRGLNGDDIRVEAQLHPELPCLRADRAQIHQVFLNLALNARDAMPRGGTLSISTGVREVGDDPHLPGLQARRHAVIAVTDTGTGMDEATLSRCFEPFFTTKATQKGTGLGLATVYGIVRTLGGDVRAASRPGQGTTFSIYLPVGPEAAVPVAGGEHPLPVQRAPCVLVVEDEEAVRALTCRLLEGEGFEVIEARNGREALSLALAHAGDLDLVLTDVVMPEMGGVALAEQLAANGVGAKIVYFSGYTDSADVLELGLAFLAKPFSAEALLRTVKAVLHGL